MVGIRFDRKADTGGLTLVFFGRGLRRPNDEWMIECRGLDGRRGSGPGPLRRVAGRSPATGLAAFGTNPLRLHLPVGAKSIHPDPVDSLINEVRHPMHGIPSCAFPTADHPPSPPPAFAPGLKETYSESPEQGKAT